ncbi:ABC transporter substrate-binding protein [Canibacter zhoujuaniae]|uniref:ABC transporter substrate-binding protein n=1 Tax=Canibacter zhoujuaniae TaxID=2708343 RepID=UPI001420FAAC|nr:ABC transporter substrate-binding protein [Canibacter zhoujuaniae]
MNSSAAETNAQNGFQRREPKKRRTGVIIGAIAALAVIGAVAAGAVLLNKSNKDESLSIGLILEPTNLDVRNTSGVALDQILLDNVYEGLITLRPGTVDEFQPALATALPEISADGLTYTFKLREGVSFHNGATLDVNDVVTSLQAGLESEDITANVSGDEAARTVTITLTQPNSELLWHLAGRAGIVLDAEATNDLANTANGTGPFKFVNWREGDSLTLERNDDYTGNNPAQIQQVVFRFIPDGRAAVNALKDGSLDVQTALLPSLRADLENQPGFDLVRAESTDVFTLAFNSARAPFDNPLVRQALSQAINTDAIITSQHGDGKTLGSPITELEPGFQNLSAVNAYNPENARILLAQTGNENLSLTITVPNHYDSAALDIVASQLQQIGVSVNIDRVDFGTWLERVYMNKDYDLSYVDHAEARDFDNYANPNYYFGYNSPQVQQLVAKARTATDPASADALLQEAAAVVAQDAPAKWLFNYTPTTVISDGVSGFPTSNTNSRINLSTVTINE